MPLAGVGWGGGALAESVSCAAGDGEPGLRLEFGFASLLLLLKTLVNLSEWFSVSKPPDVSLFRRRDTNVALDVLVGPQEVLSHGALLKPCGLR